MHDVVVVGGGVIGLALARDLGFDRSVLLFERGVVGEGTSWAAAGMLSPQSEADDDGPFFQLSMASLRMYRKFVEDVQAESGIDPEYDETGLLFVATSEEEFGTLQSRANWQKTIGLNVDVLKASDVLSLEPLITADIYGGLLIPGDHQVAPRKLAKALAEACVRRSVEIRIGVDVQAILSKNGRVTGVRAAGEVVPAEKVVICGGVWSGNIEGLAPAIPLHPRKGQILSLSAPRGAFRHMIRWSHSYFIPRRDGELVLGATNEDAGFDRSLTPAGVGRLFREAQEISSHVGRFPIREMWTGLRPATPDELPILGPSQIEGLVYATGHYRNGILLAPITAVAIAALIRGQRVPVWIEAFGATRFNV